MERDNDKTMIRSTTARTVRRQKDETWSPGGGADDDDGASNVLPVGTRLGEFTIRGVVGEGGFGIVYLAWDDNLEREVALKEYMPSALASRTHDLQVTVKSQRHRDTFTAGLKSFINEGRMLARFDSEALVKVYTSFEANGTAYMVMPLYKGVTLRQAMKDRRVTPTEDWIRNFLAGLLDAVETIHRVHCYHRDIAPDNILLLDRGGSLLLDFGAARRVIGDMTQGLTVILKPGFAPIEQYADIPGVRQGPWTDVYALAAVVYYLITGKTPPAAVSRVVHDDMLPARDAGKGRYSESFLLAVDRALAVRPEHRLQTVAELRAALGITESKRPHNVPPLFTHAQPPAGAWDAGLQAEPDATRLTAYPGMGTRMPAADRPGATRWGAQPGQAGQRAEPHFDNDAFEPTAMAPTMHGAPPRTQAREAGAGWADDERTHRLATERRSFEPPPPRKTSTAKKAAFAGIVAIAALAGGAWLFADRLMQRDGAPPLAVTGKPADSSTAAEGTTAGQTGSDAAAQDTRIASAAPAPPVVASPDMGAAPSARSPAYQSPATPPAYQTPATPPAAQSPAVQAPRDSRNGPQSGNQSGRASTSMPSDGQRLLSEDELWRSAVALNRPADYTAYLQRYPKGRYAALAKSRYEALAPAKPAGGNADDQAQNRPQLAADEEMWRRMASIGKPEAYESYLARYPNGRYAVAARDRIAAQRSSGSIAGRAGDAMVSGAGAAGGAAVSSGPSDSSASSTSASSTPSASSSSSTPSVSAAPSTRSSASSMPSSPTAPANANPQGGAGGTVAMATPAENRVTKPAGEGREGATANEARTPESRQPDPRASESRQQTQAPAPSVAESGGTRKTLKMADQTMIGDFTADFATGIVSGKGRIVWNNGEVFEGTLFRGVKEGQGTFKWKNGQTYTGTWARDQPNGKGVMVFANGNRYEGEFRDGLPHGQGTTKFKGGDVYAGNWSRGQSNGQGRYTWSNGSYWEGEFKNDQRTENGRMVFSEKALAAARNSGAASGASTSGGSDAANDERQTAKIEAK